MDLLRLSAAILVCFLVWLLCRRPTKKRKDPLSNWLLLGMLPHLFIHLDSIHEKCYQLLRYSRCTFLFRGPWFASMDILVTADPANVQYIMSTNFSNFPKGPKFKKLFDILGDGIFTSDAESWRSQRRMLQTSLTHRRFSRLLANTVRWKLEYGILPILDRVAETGATLDLQEVFQRYGSDTTWILVSGYDPGALSLDFPELELLKAMDDAEEAIFYRHVRPEIFCKLQRWLGVGHERKLADAWKTIDNFIAEYLKMKRESLSGETNPEAEEEDGAADLLTSFMKEDYTTGLDIDDKFLRDTILNLLVAGRESVNATLAWFIWLVSTNPSVEEKIREELITIIPPGEAEKRRVFELEEVSKLVYLQGVICETLRLYPTVPFQHKSALRPDVLPSGHRVDPETKIIVPLYAMGRMKSIWGKDCLEFRPERWVTEQGGLRHESSYKFFAFNAGPRICPGKEVAFAQLKAVGANIIHNYDVRIIEGHPVVPSCSVILHLKYGLKVSVTKRWPSS